MDADVRSAWPYTMRAFANIQSSRILHESLYKFKSTAHEHKIEPKSNLKQVMLAQPMSTTKLYTQAQERPTQ